MQVYRTFYAMNERARKDVIRCVEGFYKSRGSQPALGYLGPIEVHYSYQRSATTA